MPLGIECPKGLLNNAYVVYKVNFVCKIVSTPIAILLKQHVWFDHETLLPCLATLD